ncbi:3'(2'),5'-bisphosphate nucleotidase [Rhizina undulata]
MSYTKERKIAELAVQRACLLTDNVYHSQVKGTVTKEDKSPVTIADFGAQALVIAGILHAFPADNVVGEEDSDVLREQKDKRDLVWSLVKSALKETEASNAEIGSIGTEEEMLKWIDQGHHEGGAIGRIWALDPVDGTKGFLRGGQYAVALGLMVNGEVVVGAMGCPNLPVDPARPDGPKGLLFSAVRGEGAFVVPLSNPSAIPTKIAMNQITDLTLASFCESVEAGHSSHGQQASIATRLGITKPSIRMDSQAKYASIARGDGDIYLRLPTSATYEEKIWDHASGALIVEEAGGIVTDANGNKLDFTQGRTLKKNKGIVAAIASAHPAVLAAVKEELAKSA